VVAMTNMIKTYVLPFAYIAKNCHTTLRHNAECFKEHADDDTDFGFDLSLLYWENAMNPDFG
jgi:hypothetical protein